MCGKFLLVTGLSIAVIVLTAAESEPVNADQYVQQVNLKVNGKVGESVHTLSEPAESVLDKRSWQDYLQAAFAQQQRRDKELDGSAKDKRFYLVPEPTKGCVTGKRSAGHGTGESVKDKRFYLVPEPTTGCDTGKRSSEDNQLNSVSLTGKRKPEAAIAPVQRRDKNGGH